MRETKCLSTFYKGIRMYSNVCERFRAKLADTRKMKPCQPKRPHHHPPVISRLLLELLPSLSIRPLRLCVYVVTATLFPEIEKESNKVGPNDKWRNEMPRKEGTQRVWKTMTMTCSSPVVIVIGDLFVRARVHPSTTDPCCTAKLSYRRQGREYRLHCPRLSYLITVWCGANYESVVVVPCSHSLFHQRSYPTESTRAILVIMRASSSLLVNFNSAACNLLRFLLMIVAATSRTSSTTSSIVVDGAPTIGTQTVLVVGTKSPGEGGIGNSKTAEQISEAVFGKDGNGGGGMNVLSFYSTCSHGKLNLVKAQDRQGQNISILNGKKCFFVARGRLFACNVLDHCFCSRSSPNILSNI